MRKNYADEPVDPIESGARIIADALFTLLQARADLDAAKNTWSDEDIYRYELNSYNNAANAFAKAIRAAGEE